MTRKQSTEVIVVGAGFAGITAARELSGCGVDVTVVEARDRVGGRTWTQKRNGYWVDVGGQWTGPGQDRIRALGQEMGVASFPTWPEGEHLQYTDGLGPRRYEGAVPSGDIETLGEVMKAIMAFDQLSQDVPLHAPWEAPDAQRLDGMTVHLDRRKHRIGARARGHADGDRGRLHR